MEYMNNETMSPKPWMVRHKKLVIGLGAAVVVIILIGWFILNILFSTLGLQGIQSGGPSLITTFGPTTGISDAVRGVSPQESGGEGGIVSQDAERKVIKNGSLSLVVKNTEEVVEEIKDIAERYKGFVASARVYESGSDKKVGNITVRVPVSDFDAAMSDIKAFAVKVTNENVNARDVTEEFVDLEAQLRNDKASEEQYLTILKRADTVEDILKVQQQLDRIRGQIEGLQGRMNYLSRQIDMATISVSLVSEADVEIFGVVWSPLQKVKQGVRDMLSSLVNFANIVIALVFRLPAILLWVALILLVLYGVWRGFKLARGRLHW